MQKQWARLEWNKMDWLIKSNFSKTDTWAEVTDFIAKPKWKFFSFKFLFFIYLLLLLFFFKQTHAQRTHTQGT